jgi:cytochrome c oxidase subunit II
MKNRIIGWFSACLVMLGAAESFAVGYAKPWQLGFIEPASPIMESLDVFHDGLLWMIYGISTFVTLLLVYVCVRFNKKANPVPSKTSHNVLIEIIWTLIPVLILIAIALPSFKIMYDADKVEDAEMTIKIVGRQWYWQYEYPDDGIAFDSYMIPDEELKKGQLRLLDVDNRVVLPVDTNIRILITAGDVIHSWAVPAFGIKTDAVPGRTNETWVRITKPGVYYGQCSELCGVNHGFMPIAVEAVSKKKYKRWLKKAQKEFADSGSMNVASIN